MNDSFLILMLDVIFTRSFATGAAILFGMFMTVYIIVVIVKPFLGQRDDH